MTRAMLIPSLLEICYLVEEIMNEANTPMCFKSPSSTLRTQKGENENKDVL